MLVGDIPPLSHRPILSRLFWPIGFLFLATLGLVFCTIVWARDAANDLSDERARRRVEAALDDVAVAADQRTAAALAIGTPELTRGPSGLSGWLAEIQPAVAPITIVASPDLGRFKAMSAGRALDAARASALLAGARAARPGAPRSLGNGQPASAGRSRPVALDGRVHIETLSAMPHVAEKGPMLDGPGVAVLSYVPVDTDRLAAFAGVRDLRVVGPVSDLGRNARLVVGATADDAPLVLTWRPERPGDDVERRLVPLALLGLGVVAVLFGAIATHLRGMARELEASQAEASMLLGTDPVSGLANRVRFNEVLDSVLAHAGGGAGAAAVLFIDLDRFKAVNDTHGHQAGDLLLRMVADRLDTLLPTTDLLARFGGDEFAVIHRDVDGRSSSEALARRILDALTRSFVLARSQVTIGASIGIALAPEHGTDRETLMRLADAALYRAKSEGRNRFVVFRQEIDEQMRLRKVVEDDLRQAIDGDALRLAYQPIFSADGQNIVGVEALVRWLHPERGVIAPADFIPVAEESGLVVPLGEWVLRRACRDGKRWPDLRICVNVSPVQFRDRSFVANVLRIIGETGFEPGRLELELTEGVLVDDAEAAEAAMMELRAAGVHLALDDFGTGYSSLIYLRRFAIDTIKIDRSFLESLEATGECAILVHSIVALGRALGLTVTAEGVETREQQRFLQALGCQQLQGYLLSKPVSREAVDALLRPSQSARRVAAA